MNVIVGLDIGSSSIKLAQFIKKEDGLHLVKADVKEISYWGDDEASRERETLALLRKMLKGLDIKKSKFIVAINCPKTAIKKITAPYMPKGELCKGIRLQAKNYFPFSIDDALLDLEILGEVVEKGIKRYELLIAVSPKRTINRFLSLLAGLDIRPASFIPIPYALQRLAQGPHSEEAQVICFIDIGASHTELVIFSAKGVSAFNGKGQTLIFSRKIPITASDFTKEMTGVLVSDNGRTELSLDEAERIKREIGIPGAGEHKVIDNKISTTQILSMIRTPLEQLAGEIDRCLDYYREETEGARVDSLVLLGGGASLKGIADFLSEELGMEVRLGNPLGGLKVSPGAVDVSLSSKSHHMAVAIGAALSEAKGINLLPLEIKEETKEIFKRASIQAIVTGLVIALMLFYIGIRIKLSNFQKMAAAARMELSSLGPQLEQVKALELVNEILRDEPYWEDVFRELSNIVPSDVYLTEFVMKEKTITMRGVVASKEPEQSLSDFMISLEKGIFKSVRLVGTKELRDMPGNKFELECWVD